MSNAEAILKECAEAKQLLVEGMISRICKNNSTLIYSDSTEARIILDALEKQMPKKYWNHHSSTLGAVDFTIERCCPNCNHTLRYKGQQYCHECGQAIDWSDTE